MGRMSRTSRGAFGALGEEIATKYLFSKGFSVIARNYWKPWGEIDIVAKSPKGLHFVEVKSIRHIDVGEGESYRPEENAHSKKLKRVYRAIESFLAEYPNGKEIYWQMDLLALEIDTTRKQAKIRYIECVSYE